MSTPTEPKEEQTFSLRPDHKKKFRKEQVRELLSQILKEKLERQEYQPDNVNNHTKEVADYIRNRLKDLDYDRYKFIVQVVIGEQRGEGMKMGCRCFWDADSDNYAEAVFMSVRPCARTSRAVGLH